MGQDSSPKKSSQGDATAANAGSLAAALRSASASDPSDAGQAPRTDALSQLPTAADLKGAGSPPPMPKNAAEPADRADRADGPRNGVDAAPMLAQEAGKTSATETAADAAATQQRRAAKRRPAGPARSQVAANDDIPTIGALIYALEQKPSRQPFKVAAYVTGAWAALGLIFGYAMIAPELAKAASAWDVLARPFMLSLAATIVLPIGLFWFLATLVWRAQELKLMSSAMTEVAIRLAEPDRSAEQSVTSLGQTVRKQVNFMNEAVSQAIGRAGELEAMVHSEVTNLERSFQENETRIRKILGELASERTQLVATSGDVHATLRAMGDEVPALIEKLNGQQGKLARIIDSAGQNLISLEGALVKASDKLEGSLVEVSDRVGSTMQLTAEKVESTLMLASDKLDGALSDRTTHLQQVLDEYTGAINSALGNRTNEMQAVFQEYTRALDMTLTQRSEDMSQLLTARTQALDQAFAERVRLVDESILRSASTIDSVIGEKALALTSAMESHARHLSDTLGRQSSDIDETLMHGIDAVRRSSENITKQSVKAIEGLSGQADMLRSVSENLLTQVGSVTNRFEAQGQSIMRAANALETANFRIDNTLKTRHNDLNDTLQKLTGKASELDTVMQSYSAQVEGSISAAEGKARSLTHELSRAAEGHARTTLADMERLRLETEQQATRTLSDMQNQISHVGREVSAQMGTLSSRLSETSEDVRQKTQRAAAELMAEQERLRAEAERIPQATREGTEAMRRVLNEQIRALDQLTSISNREAARRDVMPPAGSAPLQSAMRSAGSLPPPPSLAAAWADHSRVARPTQQSTYAPTAAPATTAAPIDPQGHAYAQMPASTPVAADPSQHQGRWSLGELLSRASSDLPLQPHAGAPMQQAPVQVAPQVAPQAAHQAAHQGAQGPQGAPINLAVIAAALDPDTAAAIWSRYRAGQRGIMVRSIYSAEGRNTFDEVVRRCGMDPTFRATVDKFLADFEQLLRDSEMRDPSGRTVETHLASPSGRTYLFLAHAAGRLS